MLPRYISSYNTCATHGQAAKVICLNSDCKNRLACSDCLLNDHKGHVDTRLIEINQFKNHISSSFQRSEFDRLNRIHFSNDLIKHIEVEYKYLKEKTLNIIDQSEKKLQSMIQSQPIHQAGYQDMIDHISFMIDGKIYDDGLKVIIPSFLQEGVQESIAKFERQKINVTLKVKEEINRLKQLLDMNFFSHQQNKNQVKQDIAAITKKDIELYEDNLFRSVQVQFKSQAQLTQASKSQDFGITSEILNRPNYLDPRIATQFQEKQQEFEKNHTLKLKGVIESNGPICNIMRLSGGQIVICSSWLTFWTYPQLRKVHQISHDFGNRYCLELCDELILLVSNDQITFYEQRNGEWLIYSGILLQNNEHVNRFYVSDKNWSRLIVAVLSDKQLLMYHLGNSQKPGQKTIDFDRQVKGSLRTIGGPEVYPHENEVTCLGFEFDQKRVVTGDAGGRLLRWKVGDTFNIETYVVTFRDGRVCSVSQDGIIKLWNPQLQSIQSSLKHRNPIVCATRLFDYSILTGDTRGKIQIWLCSNILISKYELDAHYDSITHISFSQELIMSSSLDSKVKIWVIQYN